MLLKMIQPLWIWSYIFLWIMQVMVNDQYANYVVQKVIETCDEWQRKLILRRLRAHHSLLHDCTYAKHVVARLDRLIDIGGTQSVSLITWTVMRYTRNAPKIHFFAVKKEVPHDFVLNPFCYCLFSRAQNGESQAPQATWERSCATTDLEMSSSKSAEGDDGDLCPLLLLSAAYWILLLR